MSDHTATEAPPEAPAAVTQTNRNGATETPGQSLSDAAASSSATPTPSGNSAAAATTKADQLVDNFALKIAVTTSSIGKGLLRILARTREEVSDIWAEAQSVRRREK
jgi:hypothetical protein